MGKKTGRSKPVTTKAGVTKNGKRKYDTGGKMTKKKC